MILPRLITAIIGIPLVIIAVYWGGIPFFIMILGVVFLCLREFFILVKAGRYGVQPVIGIISGIIIFLSVFINGTKMGPLSNNQAVSFTLVFVLIIIFFREIVKSPEKAVERLSVTFFGAFFISWTLVHLVLIRNIRMDGAKYIYFLFIVIWVLDTAAYAAGKNFGRRKLASLISPKKTIEGFIGGVAGGILASVLLRFIFLSTVFTVIEALLIGLFISLASQFSDLAESLIKRDVGVKDSANLLPGHGGMFDRFDSFLFAAPLFYYYLTIFKS